MIQWATNMIGMVEYYESEYQRLKESTSVLELTLWEARTSSLEDGKAVNGGNEKMNIYPSAFKSLHHLLWAFIGVLVAVFHGTIHSRPIAL